MANGDFILDPNQLIEEARGHQVGTFGEGQAVFIIENLRKAREALNRGEITAAQYVNLAQPATQRALSIGNSISGQGSTAANVANANIFGQLGSLGIEREPQEGPLAFRFNLGQQFEQDVRESLIPENVTGELREQLLNEIPFDIGIGTDRFDIIREGVRQRVAQEQQAVRSAGLRQERLGELADILGQQREEAFSLDVPGIRERAQATGLLRTTGLAEALSRRKAELQRQVELKLAEQGLTDREKEILGREGALQTQLGFQTAGLQRDLSLEDFFRQAQFARELAEQSRPSGSKTSGERRSQQAQLGLTGLQIGTNIAARGATGGGGKR